MLLNAYVIFDSKARIYNKPFYFVNDDVALRSAGQVMADPNSDIATHPEDFTMFKIGTYNDEHASFDLLEAHEVICRFNQVKPAVTPNNINQPIILEDQDDA